MRKTLAVLAGVAAPLALAVPAAHADQPYCYHNSDGSYVCVSSGGNNIHVQEGGGDGHTTMTNLHINGAGFFVTGNGTH